jgi:hypothetical protein
VRRLDAAFFPFFLFFAGRYSAQEKQRKKAASSRRTPNGRPTIHDGRNKQKPKHENAKVRKHDKDPSSVLFVLSYFRVFVIRLLLERSHFPWRSFTPISH